MPTRTNETVVYGGIDGVDLASCGTAQTVTITTNIVERDNPGDQFTLNLKQGASQVASVTTTGATKGIQEQQLGPFPVTPGVDLTIEETGANGANLTNYASSWACYADGTQYAQSKTDGSDATRGTFPAIPPGAKSVMCTFTNAPLVADVTVTKKVVDAPGAAPRPDSGWPVTIHSTSGATLVGNSPTTRTTDGSGRASWNFAFTSKNASAVLSVSENQAGKPGYQIDPTQSFCTVTHQNNLSDEPVQATSLAAINGVTIIPGDTVDCTFVNVTVGTLSITKRFDDSVTGVTPTATFSGDYACTVGDDVVASGTWTVDGEGPADLTPTGAPTSSASETQPILAGAQCEVTETAPTTGSLTGLPMGYAWQGPTISNPDTIEAGQQQTVTVTNGIERRPGSVTWTKVDPDHAALSGSEWMLTGPESFTALEKITDNGPWDADPAEGVFRIEGLPWGDYTLTETKAPAGYVRRSDPITFTVNAASYKAAGSLTINHGVIVNDPRASVVLPLTGGLGSDFLYLAGGGMAVTGIGLLSARSVGARIRRRHQRPGARA